MPQAKSVNAYPECQKFMNQIVEENKAKYVGPFSTHGLASKWRHNCYKSRAAWRAYMRRAYQDNPDNPSYDSSPWDSISLTIEQHSDGYWIYGTCNAEDALKGLEIKDAE